MKALRTDWVVRHAPWELLLMRVFFAGALAYSIRENWPTFTSQPVPHGLARWFDFSFLSNPSLFSLLEPVCWVCLGVYAAGFLPVLSLGFVSFLGIGAGTLMNSQGAIGHTTQLLVMVVTAQFLCYAWFAASENNFLSPSQNAHTWAADWSKVVIAAGYTVSGVVKLVRTEGEWIARSPLLSLQLMKTNEMDYYNRLMEGQSFWADTFPRILVEHPWLAWIIFGLGLFLELFCFLAMLGRVWALAFGASLIVMHLTISKIMRLSFEEHMLLLLIFFVNVPFWAAWLVNRTRQRRRPA
jgi:hypothetical protein